MRDDFSKPTKEKLAHRASYRCSKPDCGALTRGAASDSDGTIDIGVAAHITAASPGGPRFDSTFTSDQRKHRAGRRFRSSFLGQVVLERIAVLPVEVRKDVVFEIASNSGMDGINLRVVQVEWNCLNFGIRQFGIYHE